MAKARDSLFRHSCLEGEPEALQRRRDGPTTASATAERLIISRVSLKGVIRSGDYFLAGKTGGVIGAVVPWRGRPAGVAPAHVLSYAGTPRLRVGNQDCKVGFIPNDADIALFPILGSCSLTELGRPRLGEVTLENAAKKRSCRISDLSWSIFYVVLPPGDLPGPGDSGTPLVQDGLVVGMLLSFNMHTCKGIAVSADMIRDVSERTGK